MRSRLIAAVLLATAIACGGSGPATILQPPSLDAEWPVASAEQQGLDARALADYVQSARAGRYGEIHSLLVVRRGYLVSEEYFGSDTQASLHPVYSVTKSVTSALIGIASDRGRLASLRQNLLALFPEYRSVGNMTAEKAAITLEDVLTMRAGFEWDEWTYPYGDPRNGATQLAGSSDWIRYVLDLPMASRPGASFAYNSGCTVLLAGVLRNVNGAEARDFARDALFEAIGIRELLWESGPGGLTNTGWGLQLRPRDMARFGLLFLRGGDWNGRRVVSQAWVDASTARHVRFADGSGYGYQWWRMPLVEGGAPGSDDIRFAWGWGGQFIFVVPSLEMVVVSTAGDYARSQAGALTFIQALLRDMVRG